jgi:hypothetical protein
VAGDVDVSKSGTGTSPVLNKRVGGMLKSDAQK